MDFKNTIIIMTSNVGAHLITEPKKNLGFEGEDLERKLEESTTRELVMAELRKTFRPEFLNRIDGTIMFHKLTEEHIQEIAVRMLKVLSGRLEGMDIPSPSPIHGSSRRLLTLASILSMAQDRCAAQYSPRLRMNWLSKCWKVNSRLEAM